MSLPNKKSVYILGISAYYHDSAACLVMNGTIVAAAQEERFTRKKHDAGFPKNAVEFCLKQAKIKMEDVNYVGFYEKPFLKFERLLLTYFNNSPWGLHSFLKSLPIWLKERIFLKDLIAKELGFEGEIIFPEHHESHAASAFFPSPFKNAAFLTIDGVGEWTTTCYGLGQDNTISLDAEIQFPHSLGFFYSAFTYYCGFLVNSGEYKLMGLAPYGQPKYVDVIRREIIDIKTDGSFCLNMSYFNYCKGLTMTNERFHRLFGRLPRIPDTEIAQLDMDIARSVQEVIEEVVLKMAGHVGERTGCENLCLAGGVALNCVINGKIIKQGKFKNVWIQPAAGDDGGALGAALFIWYQYLINPRYADGENDLQQGSFLGPEYSLEEIDDFLKASGVPFEKYEGDKIFDRVAELVDNGKIIGLVQGRMEFGPRALGARSIIGDARSVDMQQTMNLRIKFRESFRPFAPSVLYEKSQEYFDLPCESPYMHFVAQVKDNHLNREQVENLLTGFDKLKVKYSSIPAVTHVDNSARVQTVDEKRNPFFYKIIEAFYKRTGCPVVINTSFNVRGEPIVCTLQDAYSCFMCTDLDYLVLDRFILDKDQQPNRDEYKKEQYSKFLD